MGKSGLPGTQKGAFAVIFSESGGFDNKFFSIFAPVLEKAGNYANFILT
jgi:hypothetical protein